VAVALEIRGLTAQDVGRQSRRQPIEGAGVELAPTDGVGEVRHGARIV
jgi:hypothetical protein